MNHVWFTSDTHFGHKNALKLNNRPYSTIKEMEDDLIKKWNFLIRPQDIVYHLGDFCFRYDFGNNNIINIINSLNGKKHLIVGNHDKELLKYIEQNNINVFESIEYLKVIKYNKIKITLCHYPMMEWDGSHYGHIHLHGHCHGNRKYDLKNSMDVGVDCTDYYPVNLESVFKHFNKL